MKNVFNFVVISFLMITGCDEAELSSKSYPYVVMESVSTSNEGVEFVAAFKGLGQGPVKRFGFKWWKEEDLTISYEKEINGPAALGSFSLKVESDLEPGVKYQVRPFAENATTKVLGDVMSFESKGTKAPTIIDFSPKTGGPGDLITITGSNFSISESRVHVALGEDNGIVLSCAANEIKFKVPDNVSKSGAVALVVKSGNITLSAAQPFVIKGQTIVDFNPKAGIIGESEVVITGNGFLASGNKVMIGIHQMIILEENATQIKIKLPYEMQAGPAAVQVEINGQLAEANGIFTVKSRWVRLADFPGAARLDAFSQVVGDFLYVIGGDIGLYSDEVWKYDIVNDSWTRLGNFPGGGRSGGIGFAIGNTLYYGLGAGSGGIDDFWSFDTVTEQWKETYSLGSVQGPPATTSVNGIGYILGGSYDGNFSFTEQTGWTYLGIPTMISIATMYDDYFEIDGVPYLLDLLTDGSTGEKTYNLYKASKSDPTTWTFIENAPFTDKYYRGICFSTDDFAYIGEGIVEYEERKFMKRNHTTNEWIQIENFQGPLLVRSGISFSYNNKGYVGFGLVRQPNSMNFGPSNQFWKYDPTIQ